MKSTILILSLFVASMAVSQSNVYQVYQLDTKESINACEIVAYMDNLELDAGYIESINGSIITLRIAENTDYLIHINDTKYFKINGSEDGDLATLPKITLIDAPALIYRIQLGAFSKTIPTSFSANFKDIVTEEMNGTKITRIMTGSFISLEDAAIAVNQIKSTGNQDAFIVAYFDGERIEYAEALKKEKQKDQVIKFELTMLNSNVHNQSQTLQTGLN